MDIALNKCCSFFGHRKIEITCELKNYLTKIIVEKITKENYVNFYFGGFGEFDDLCYKIVTNLQSIYSHIRRIFCLYDSRHTKYSKRPTWLKMEKYEDYIYLEPTFNGWYKRIYYRNLEIINLSDCIIFYVNNYENSGAYKALTYARQKKKDFINVAINNN